MTTVHVSFDLYGSTQQVDVFVPCVDASLSELYPAASRALNMHAVKHRPSGRAVAQVNISRFEVYDRSMLQWKPLVDSDQVRDDDSLYAFQRAANPGDAAADNESQTQLAEDARQHQQGGSFWLQYMSGIPGYGGGPAAAPAPRPLLQRDPDLQEGGESVRSWLSETHSHGSLGTARTYDGRVYDPTPRIGGRSVSGGSRSASGLPHTPHAPLSQGVGPQSVGTAAPSHRTLRVPGEVPTRVVYTYDGRVYDPRNIAPEPTPVQVAPLGWGGGGGGGGFGSSAPPRQPAQYPMKGDGSFRR